MGGGIFRGWERIYRTIVTFGTAHNLGGIGGRDSVKKERIKQEEILGGHPGVPGYLVTQEMIGNNGHIFAICTSEPQGCPRLKHRYPGKMIVRLSGIRKSGGTSPCVSIRYKPTPSFFGTW